MSDPATKPVDVLPTASMPQPHIGLSKTLAILALVAGSIAMGISPIFVRISNAADVGPFASAFWRVCLALPVLALWARLEERGDTAKKPTFTKATLWAGLLFTGDLFFWHLSILATTVANATFFGTTAPFWVVGVTWFIFKERISRGVLMGMALCLAGGLVLIGSSLDIDPARIKGDIFGLGTAFFFGLYFFAIKAARGEAGAGRVTYAASLITAVLLGIVAWISGDTFIPATMSGGAALVAMAVVSHAGGQGLLAVALGRLPTVFTSLVIFLEAVAASAVAWVVLGEALTLLQTFGGALILGGIWIARPKDDAAAEKGV